MTVNPPNGEISPKQRETLSEWFSTLQRKNRGHQFIIDFSLTLGGDKPATSLRRANLVLQGGPFVAVNQGVDFVERLGFATKQLTEGESWFCARNSDRFNLLLPKAPSEDATVHQAGEFFGYPKRSVEWFAETPAHERISPRTRSENGDFPPRELAHVDLLSYLHEDSIEGYERAIEAGKQIRQRLAEVADHWDLPVIDEMVEEHYEAHRAVYSGEKEHYPGEQIGFKMICKNPALD